MSKTVWIVNQYASTPDHGFAGRHYYLGRELAKRGYTVYLIASAAHHLHREKPAVRTKFEVKQESAGFFVVWVDLPSYTHAHSKGRILGWFLFAMRIRGIGRVIQEKPDVVVCSSPSLISFFGARALSRKFDAKLVFEVRDIWPMTLVDVGGYSTSHPFIRLLQYVEDKAYRDADLVVSNLRYAVEHMVSRGMDPDKFAWVPNGFSEEEVGLKAPLNDEASQKLPDGKFLVGYTGTLGVANSLYTLVHAAERLMDYPEILFVLVGDGREKESLKELVGKKELGNVLFIDPIPKIEIQSMLARFDVCYIGLSKDPLYHFGVSPNKLFDYLYSGKPIIYGIESGKYRPVEEARAGIQIPANDPESLAQAVLELYRTPAAKRLEMGARGHDMAIREYEYGELSSKLAQVLFS